MSRSASRKDQWLEVPLGDVLEDTKSGFATGADLSDGIFQIRMNNVTRDGRLNLEKRRRVPSRQKNLHAFLLEPGDVLFNATNSPDLVGKTAFFGGLDEPVVFSNHFLRLRVQRNAVDPRFVARWLIFQFQRGVFRHRSHQWVNQATVGRDVLLNMAMPLPPPEQQRRIVQVLDRVVALRAKRRVTTEKLQTLKQSIFLDMFGDPVTNPRGFERVPLDRLLSSIDSGWSPKCMDRPVRGDEWGVLKLGAVTWGTYNPLENKALPPDIEPRPKNEVQRGDVLFSRKNTRDLVAATALVYETPPRLMLSDLIFRLRLKEDATVEPTYLHHLLSTPSKRKRIQKLAGGSAGSMPNISKTKLSTVPIELPPLGIQREFAKEMARIRSSHMRQELAQSRLDHLFASIQQRAFRGEL